MKIFVGNLSYFCGRDELERLFSTCGDIENIHVCKSNSGDTMHFAFVTFVNNEDAEKAIASLNNSLFMGRNICVRPADRTIARQYASSRKLEGWEVMFSFISHQREVMVCEESLRGLFSQYGSVLDCVIRSYSGELSGQSARGLQNGYGFVEFQEQEVAEYVVKNVKAGLLTNTSEPPSDDRSASVPSVHVDCSLSRRSAARLAQISGVSAHNQVKQGVVEQSNQRQHFHQQKDFKSSTFPKPSHPKSKGPEKLDEHPIVTEKTPSSPFIQPNPASGTSVGPLAQQVVYPQPHFVQSPPVYSVNPNSPLMQPSYTQMPSSPHMSSSHYFPSPAHFPASSIAPVMSNTNYPVMSMSMHPATMVQYGYPAQAGGLTPPYLPPSATLPPHPETTSQPMQGPPPREYQELHSYQYPNTIHQPPGHPQPTSNQQNHGPPQQVLRVVPPVYPIEANPKEAYYSVPSHFSQNVTSRPEDDRDFVSARRQVASYPTNPTNIPVHSGHPMPSQPQPPQGPFYTVFYSSPPQESPQASLVPPTYAMNAQFQLPPQVPTNHQPPTHTNAQQPPQRYPSQQHPSSHFPYYQSHQG